MANGLLPFDDDPIVQVVEVSSLASTNAERFAAFHEQNPQVYRLIVRIARQAKALGARRFGIAACFERLRWVYLETHGDIYKLNNTYRAFYARLVMDREPDLADLFETRESPHDPHYYDREVRA